MLKIKQIILTMVLLFSSMTLATSSFAKNFSTQQGKASWYGGKHHGKKTASGVAYNMYSDTVAHKTLKFGTKLEIINLDNGKKSYGVVRDRGPYHGNRILDTSYKIAQDIGIVKTGTANVKINILH